VGATETIVVPKRTGDGHYVISATGISAAAVAVAIRDADGEFTTVLADLEEAFGLTPCEVQVIEKLMHGHAAQHIADELDISVHTVRAHLRHCYDKLEVRSREELWQRLAPYRIN
jgi:DNA-binding NarL/FixJ family response regulator